MRKERDPILMGALIFAIAVVLIGWRWFSVTSGEGPATVDDGTQSRAIQSQPCQKGDERMELVSYAISPDQKTIRATFALSPAGIPRMAQVNESSETVDLRGCYVDMSGAVATGGAKPTTIEREVTLSSPVGNRKVRDAHAPAGNPKHVPWEATGAASPTK